MLNHSFIEYTPFIFTWFKVFEWYATDTSPPFHSWDHFVFTTLLRFYTCICHWLHQDFNLINKSNLLVSNKWCYLYNFYFIRCQWSSISVRCSVRYGAHAHQVSNHLCAFCVKCSSIPFALKSLTICWKYVAVSQFCANKYLLKACRSTIYGISNIPWAFVMSKFIGFVDNQFWLHFR